MASSCEPQLPPSYMLAVSGVIVAAQKQEHEKKYKEAFTLYQQAIDTLLKGAKEDNDEGRRKSIYTKVDQLYQTASYILECHIIGSSSKRTSLGSELLREYQVIGLSGRCPVVQHVHTGRVLFAKTILKSVKAEYISEALASGELPSFAPENGISTVSVVPVDCEHMTELVSLCESDRCVVFLLNFYSRHAYTLLSPGFVPPMVVTTQLLPHSPVSFDMSEPPTPFNVSHANGEFHFDVQSPNGEDFAAMIGNLSKRTSLISLGGSSSYSGEDDFSRAMNGRGSTSDDGEPQLRPNGDMRQSASSITITQERDAAENQRCEVILRILRQLVQGLHSFHQHNLVWRDFHPRNMLLDDDDSLKLTFVSAWQGVERSLSTEAIRGGYVAPELIFNPHEDSPAADWWSFGVVMFELFEQTSFSCVPMRYSNLPSSLRLQLTPKHLRPLLTNCIKPASQRPTGPDILCSALFAPS